MPFAILLRHDAGAIKLKWPNIKEEICTSGDYMCFILSSRFRKK